jgi:PPOX class probable F420-dependent enzyme
MPEGSHPGTASAWKPTAAALGLWPACSAGSRADRTDARPPPQPRRPSGRQARVGVPPPRPPGRDFRWGGPGSGFRRAFLTEGTRTAVLATIREDGRPYAVRIAFVLDDDDILFVTNAETVKGRDLVRDPRVTLVVDDEVPPFAFVMIEGTAVASPDVGNVEQLARRISQRYDAGEGMEEFVRFAREELGMLVRVAASRIVALERVGEH